MPDLDRWICVVKVIGVIVSTCSAILVFGQQVIELFRKIRKKRQKSPHRVAR